MRVRVCSVIGCGRPHKALGLCSSHYSRLYVRGNIRRGVLIGHREIGTDLPNPWINVSPPCPLCSSSVWVFLWANEGESRWFCQTCRKRFDVVAEAVA